MGRLTLNVLLSFAQFEREVTGERIRDKIAASKARGMWMGGNLPLGYDLPAEGRRALVVNPDEAATVRAIFQAYLELGSVSALERWLAERGIASKARTTRDGRRIGSQPYNRGALFYLLRNRTYLGMIVHRDKLHRHAPGGRSRPTSSRRSGATRGQSAPARRPPRPGGARAADRPHLRCRRQPDVAELQLWPAQEALSLLCLGAAAAGSTPTGRMTRRSGGFQVRRSKRG